MEADEDPRSPMRLLIADHAPTRRGIRLALGDMVDICAEAGDAEEAIRAAKREQPEICLIARDLPGGGLAGVRGICRAAPGTSVIVLAGDPNVDDLLDVVRAGAIGYVPEELAADRLRAVIGAVEAREAVVPRSMVLELLAELRGAGDGGDLLTRREAQVLGMVRRGHSTAAIAERLKIAPVTVRRHISELVHKLGVENRATLSAATEQRRALRVRPVNGSVPKS
jgi:DNA-binding NarL/FixJ family response regulator